MSMDTMDSPVRDDSYRTVGLTWSLAFDTTEPRYLRLESYRRHVHHMPNVQHFYKGTGIRYSLSYLETSLFASILEDTLTQMRILTECNTEAYIQKLWTDMPILLAKKFGVAISPNTDELAGIDQQNLELAEYKLAKLEADRNILTSTLVSSYLDLSKNQTYTPLIDYVNNICKQDEHRARLQEDDIKNKTLRRELCKQMRQQKNHIKSVLYDTDAIIDGLRSQVQDSLLYSECKSRYVDNWQRARTEQHLQTIKDEESGPLESIEHHKLKTENEQRVHSEVETLISIAINETLEQVEKWMTKYDNDIEGMDLKIQIRKNEYHDMVEKRESLEATIEKHDVMMKEWNEFKVEREKARLYREKMTNAALVVQAWWRGMLVRRELGPFKPKKKPKQPKK